MEACRLPALLAAVVGLAPAAAVVSVLDSPKLCPNETVIGGIAWPTRHYADNCTLPVRTSPSRETAEEINLVVLSPYSGSVGDMVTMTEPMMLLAAQEIEDSALLPGFRVRFHLVDTRCSGPDATLATIRAMSAPPQKHGIIGDCCSSSCVGINVPARYFEMLQIAPNCISNELSVRTDYPYFVRMAPSLRFHITAALQVAKLFRWRRVGLVIGPEDICKTGMNQILQSTDADSASAAYNWTVLATDLVASPADAQQTVARLVRRDARIVVTLAYENVGAMLLCEADRQGMAAPEYVFLLILGWWNQNFMQLQQGPAGCTAAQMLSAGFGTVGVDRGGPVTGAGLVHGLSGRKLADILSDYMSACSAFAGGQGACNPQFAAYFYDTLWEFALILDGYLVQEARGYDTLGTAAARSRLYELALRVAFQGLTGRVRHFNGVDPTTPDFGGSYGDREGNIAVRQIRALPPMSFVDIGTWSSSRMEWTADIVWSPVSNSHRIPCAAGVCNFSTAWLPSDQTWHCPPGTVWSNKLGCDPCPAGKFGAANTSECLPCGVGTFSNQQGASACTSCAPGTANKELAAVACRTCDAGAFVGRTGGSECLWCEAGTYSEGEGATACRSCEATFTTQQVASRHAADCRCGEGTYLPLGGSACAPCPDGFVCPFDSQEANIPTLADAPPRAPAASYPQVPVGYYTLSSDPLSLFACASADICPGGPPESCALHHGGLACGRCEDHYYHPAKGTCQPCRGKDVVPIILVCVLALMVLAALAIYAMYDSGDQRLTLVTAALSIGQLVCTVQALGIMAQLQVQWSEPIAMFVRLGSLIAMDADVLKIQCVLGQDSPIQNFLLRLMAPPAVAVVLGVLLLINGWRVARKSEARWILARFDWGRFRNSCGLLLVMVYVPVTIAMLRPLNCTRHPNGLRSMASSKAVLCWHSREHAGLVAMSLVGLLCFPVALLSWVGAAVWRYPRFVAAGMGPKFLATHRFLFARFKLESFYWGFFYLLRNLALSLVPVFCPDSGVLQITLLCCIFLLSGSAEGLLLPWRTPLANASELSSMAGLLLFLQLATSCVPGSDAAKDLVSVLLLVTFVATIGATLVIALHALYRYLHPNATYAVFLSHHKEGAGSLARWFKIRMSLLTRASVFLDADELEELDMLVEIVQSRTRNLVVLLTRLTLARPWCAAEISAAAKSRVNIVPVACHDYVPPSQVFFDDLGNLWSYDQCQVFAHYGIQLEHIRAAFHSLLLLPSVALGRFDAIDTQQQVVVQVLGRAGVTSMAHTSWSRIARAQILVAGASCDPEARSTCEVMKHMVEARTQVSVAVVHSAADTEVHRETALYVLVVLTRGLLTDSKFAEVGASVEKAMDSELEVVPTLADATFAFPIADHFKQPEGEDQVHLAAFLRRVFNVLALQVSPHGSALVMNAQVEKICRRFKSRAVGPQSTGQSSAGQRGAKEPAYQTGFRLPRPGFMFAKTASTASLPPGPGAIAPLEAESAPVAPNAAWSKDTSEALVGR